MAQALLRSRVVAAAGLLIASAACVGPDPEPPHEPCVSDRGLSTKDWRLAGSEGSYNLRLPPGYERWNPRSRPSTFDTDVRVWRGKGCRSITVDFGALDPHTFDGRSIEYSQCLQDIDGHRAHIAVGWDATGRLAVPEGYMCRTYAVVAVLDDVPMTFIGTTSKQDELPQLLAALHSLSIEKTRVPGVDRKRTP